MVIYLYPFFDKRGLKIRQVFKNRCKDVRMENKPHKPIGGRRIPRPQKVMACPQCGEAVGTNYHDCAYCHTAIESIWLADWKELLLEQGVRAGSEEERMLARVVTSEFGRHAWTVMDIAMSLQRCSQCGNELGAAYQECAECGMAFGASIQAEFEATPNEHALHIGRWVLRYPERHSANAVAAWRLTLPRILTGWLPSNQEAQRAMAMIKAGQLEQVQMLIRRVDAEINH
jgi:uncharacterized protein (UPF0212 family)